MFVPYLLLLVLPGIVSASNVKRLLASKPFDESQLNGYAINTKHFCAAHYGAKCVTYTKTTDSRYGNVAPHMTVYFLGPTEHDCNAAMIDSKENNAFAWMPVDDCSSFGDFNAEQEGKVFEVKVNDGKWDYCNHSKCEWNVAASKVATKLVWQAA